MTSATQQTPSVQSSSRVDPPLQANEEETLLGFLNYHRQTFRVKTGGLTAEQLAATLGASPMTLGGMMKHLALVEVNWFSEVLHDDRPREPWSSVDWDADADWDWHSASDDAPGDLWALFEESVAVADDGIARAVASGGLGTLSVRTDRRTKEQFSLRWILAHMIEEYARHNGHADLIRESIDGSTGE